MTAVIVGQHTVETYMTGITFLNTEIPPDFHYSVQVILRICQLDVCDED